MIKKVLILLCLVTGVVHAQSIDSLEQIDALFSKWNNATPGVAIAIERKNKIIYKKAFGLADLEHLVPNTTETIFESGSVAKQFTAMCILLLAADGKLSLTDDIRKYVPEIPKYSAPITIQHLLNHTSGLKDWGSVGALSGWPRTTRVYTQELALQIMCQQKTTNYTPGTEYSYSNANYTLLVTIAERVSGQSLAEFTRLRFFEPLGMNHTQWRNNFREVIPNRAIAYSKTANGYQQLMPFENIHGHGGLLTTVADLLKWNQLLEHPSIGGDRVYQWRVQTGKLTNGQPIDYAAGLFIDQFNGWEEISHSGATAGYRAWLAYYPKKKLSVVLLSNDGSFNPAGAGRDIAAIFFGKKENAKRDTPPLTLSEADLKRYEGIYRSLRHFEVKKLEYKNGKLYGDQHELRALHRDTLVLNNERWIYAQPNHLLHQTANDTSLFKKVAPPDLTSASLLSLAGEYRSDEADVTYFVEVKNSELWVQIKSFAPFKLNPSFRDGFFSENGDLYEFARDRAKKVKQLQVSTSRAEKISFTYK